jgi:hypothetical protein
MEKSIADKKERLDFEFYIKNNNDVLIINWYMYTLPKKKNLTQVNTNLKRKTFHSPKEP